MLQVQEVADLLHITSSGVRKLKEKDLPHERTLTTGRHRRYRPSVVAAYLAERGAEVPEWLAKLVEVERTEERKSGGK